MRLIDADKLMERCKMHCYPVRYDHKYTSVDYGLTLKGIRQVIDETNIVDAVPVVRCRECIHWKPPHVLQNDGTGRSVAGDQPGGGYQVEAYARMAGEFPGGMTMANVKDLTVTVNANLTVSDETAERCLRLLEMWQADNPDRKIEGEWMEGGVVFRIVHDPLEPPEGGNGDG